MKGKKVRQYRKSETQNLVHVYEVSGTEAEINAYEEAQGDNLVCDDDSGAPLFFTTNFVNKNIKIGMTQAGNPFVDTTEMDELSSIVDNAPGKLGEAIAAEVAKKLVAGLSFGGNSASIAAPVQETATEEIAEDEGEDLSEM